jgi:hypothetical protein
MSLGQAKWATRAVGLLGEGVGSATSGARHVSNVQRTLAPGEGGVGKIMAELGLPGLILIAWFMLALARLFWQILRYTSRLSPQTFRLSIGLISFLVANCMIFVVNTQIFSDFFILIIFGFAIGFLLAMPVLAGRAVASSRDGSAEAVPTQVWATAQAPDS